jgi:hypothetical protein
LIRGAAAILLLGGTAAAVKLSQKDVNKVEAATGKSADDLTEADLLAAMRKLGIQKLELTAEDEAAIDQADQEDDATG